MNNKQMEMMAREHDMTAFDTETAEEVVQATTDGVKMGYQKIEDTVVGGYKAIENGVVSAYKAIENGAVEGFAKVTDKCVETLFAKEGESAEDAKKRLSGEK